MSYSSNTHYKANSEALIGVEVTAGGARVLTNVQLGLFLSEDDVVKDSPEWKDPETVDNRWGYMMDGTMDPGVYEVWAKVSTTEEPFLPIPCGTITLY